MASSTPKQRALVLRSKDTPLSLEEIPVPTATPGSAVVQILGASLPPMARGVITENIPFPKIHPLVPGSTAIGRIHTPGPDVTTLTPGQLVYIDIFVRSRDDPGASILLGWVAGFDANSAKLMQGEWRNGTLAEFAKVPLENLYALDEELLCKSLGYSFADLNWLGPCLVPAGGLMEIDVKAGETVIVAPGTGFFSGAAVHMALGMGAKVIAAGRNKVVLAKMVETFEATERFVTVQLSGDVGKDTAALKGAAGADAGADAYIDFSPPSAPKSPHLQACIMALRPFGRCVLMGGVFANVEIPYAFIMLNSIRIQGRYMFDRSHAMRVIKLVETKMMRLGAGNGSGVHAQIYKFEDVEKALDAAEGSGWGSMIVVEP